MAFTIDTREIQSSTEFTLKTKAHPQGIKFTVPPLDSDTFNRISVIGAKIDQQNPNNPNNIKLGIEIGKLIIPLVSPNDEFRTALDEIRNSSGDGKESFAYVWTLIQVSNLVAKTTASQQ